MSLNKISEDEYTFPAKLWQLDPLIIAEEIRKSKQSRRFEGHRNGTIRKADWKNKTLQW